MKAYKMRATARDPKTRRIIGYSRPITVRADIADEMIVDAPDGWEIMDDNVEVENDPRLGRNRIKWIRSNDIDDAITEARTSRPQTPSRPLPTSGR